MILKLNNKFLLRGWKGAGCALVNRESKEVHFFHPNEFNLLLLCDGSMNIDENELSESEKSTIKENLEKGILEICETPAPISEIQEYRMYQNRFVKSILWSVTGKCNFNCRHCYMNAPKGQLGEITHEQAISFIDQMAECGIFDVSLTGGEPLIRPDIRELLSYMTDYGIKISLIYTNGWALNESLLEFLDAIGQKPEFNFSFDGIGCHDWMRGVNGAEQRVLRAIKLCQEKGFPTGMEMCMHKGNAHSLRDTVKLMGELNTHMKVGSLLETELWKQKGENMQLAYEEYFEKILEYLPSFFEDGMPVNLTLGTAIRLKKGSTDYKILAEKYDGTEACLDHKMCGAARSCAYISPEGRLMPCMPMTSWKGHMQFKKIQEIGLQKGLTDSFYMNFVNGTIRELFEHNQKCNNCEYKLRCGGGCRACALEDTDGLYASDPNQCFYWKNGFIDIIRETTEKAIVMFCK